MQPPLFSPGTRNASVLTASLLAVRAGENTNGALPDSILLLHAQHAFGPAPRGRRCKSSMLFLLSWSYREASDLVCPRGRLGVSTAASRLRGVHLAKLSFRSI